MNIAENNISGERMVGFEFETTPTLKGPTSGYLRQLRFSEVIESLENCGVKRFPYNKNELDQSYLMRKWWSNGMCTYQDMENIELCSPETYPQYIGVWNIVAENIVLDALSLAAHFRDDGHRYDQYHAFRTGNYNHEDLVTSGYHENYQLIQPEIVSNYPVRRFLSSFAILRTIITGQGIVDSQGTFEIAQKVFPREQSGEKNRIKIHEDRYDTRCEVRTCEYPATVFGLKHNVAFFSALLRVIETDESRREEMIGDFTLKDTPLQSKLSGGIDIDYDTEASFVYENDQHKELTAAQFILGICGIIKSTPKFDAFPLCEQESVIEYARLARILDKGTFMEASKDIHWLTKKYLLQKIQDTNKDPLVVDLMLDTRGDIGKLDAVRKGAWYERAQEQSLREVTKPKLISERARRRIEIIKKYGDQLKMLDWKSYQTSSDAFHRNHLLRIK